MKKSIFQILTGILLSSIAALLPVYGSEIPCSKLPPITKDSDYTGWQLLTLEIQYGINNLESSLQSPPNKENGHHLSATVKEWLNLDCRDDNGFSRLNALGTGIQDGFVHAHPINEIQSRRWDDNLIRVERFKRDADDPALATLIEAGYWISYAWDARGHGYASSVTPEGWKLFKQRLENAENVLVQNKKIASTIPTWYIEMIQVQTGLGRPQKDRDAIFMEGAKRYPKFYSLYEYMLSYTTPKWGGSWEMSNALIEWATNNSMSVSGNTTYAWLYNSLRESMPNGESMFKVTGAKWPRIKLGFDEHIQRYPNSQIYDTFAATACEAGDKVAYIKNRKKIKRKIDSGTWKKSYPRELCDAKYGFNQ